MDSSNVKSTHWPILWRSFYFVTSLHFYFVPSLQILPMLSLCNNLACLSSSVLFYLLNLSCSLLLLSLSSPFHWLAAHCCSLSSSSASSCCSVFIAACLFLLYSLCLANLYELPLQIVIRLRFAFTNLVPLSSSCMEARSSHILLLNLMPLKL